MRVAVCGFPGANCDYDTYYVIRDLMEDFVDVAGVITKEVKHHIYPSLKGHGKELPEEVLKVVICKHKTHTTKHTPQL